MAHNIQQLQMAIEDEYKGVQALQIEYKRLDDAKQKLIEQQSENNIVKKEIDLLEEESVIYKQYGPVLVK
jgi:chaperonin cofactor prefoldin